MNSPSTSLCPRTVNTEESTEVDRFTRLLPTRGPGPHTGTRHTTKSDGHDVGGPRGPTEEGEPREPVSIETQRPETLDRGPRGCPPV